MSLRVLLYTVPAPLGGLETVVSQLAMALAERDVDVTLAQLLLPTGKSPRAFLDLSDSRITHVIMRHEARDYLGARAALRQLVHETRSTIVHSHGARADLIARLARVHPLVCTVHGFVANSARQRLTRWLHKQVLRHADAVVAVSSPMHRQLSAEVDAQRVHLLTNAPPVGDGVSRAEARRRLGVSEDGGPCIGWVGRASREKGLDLFIEALRELRIHHGVQPQVVIVGDGPERAELERQVREEGITSVSFAGARADAAQLYSAFDVLALTSRTEGTPMTVLEAVSQQVPVVGTPVGGVPALLEDGAGWLSADVSVPAIAKVLAEALSEPSQRETRARVAYQRLDPERRRSEWVTAHLALYRSLS